MNVAVRCLRSSFACLGQVEESGNYIFLLSNETRDNLLKWVREMKNLDKIGLAAEDG